MVPRAPASLFPDVPRPEKSLRPLYRPIDDGWIRVAPAIGLIGATERPIPPPWTVLRA